MRARSVHEAATADACERLCCRYCSCGGALGPGRCCGIRREEGLGVGRGPLQIQERRPNLRLLLPLLVFVVFGCSWCCCCPLFVLAVPAAPTAASFALLLFISVYVHLMQVCFDDLTAADAMARNTEVICVEEPLTIAGLEAIADKSVPFHHLFINKTRRHLTSRLLQQQQQTRCFRFCCSCCYNSSSSSSSKCFLVCVSVRVQLRVPWVSGHPLPQQQAALRLRTCLAAAAVVAAFAAAAASTGSRPYPRVLLRLSFCCSCCEIAAGAATSVRTTRKGPKDCCVSPCCPRYRWVFAAFLAAATIGSRRAFAHAPCSSSRSRCSNNTRTTSRRSHSSISGRRHPQAASCPFGVVRDATNEFCLSPFRAQHRRDRNRCSSSSSSSRSGSSGRSCCWDSSICRSLVVGRREGAAAASPYASPPCLQNVWAAKMRVSQLLLLLLFFYFYCHTAMERRAKPCVSLAALCCPPTWCYRGFAWAIFLCQSPSL